jgi:DNA-binding response OmpR family regulator
VARLLLVDDEPDILLMLQINLEMEGHEVVLAGNGEEALDRIADSAPDVVLLDVMMPVLDGFGVLERLAATDGHRPPVIMISAKAQPSDARQAYRLGADGYVTKPFDLERLTAQVLATLDRTPEEREAHRRAELGPDR